MSQGPERGGGPGGLTAAHRQFTRSTVWGLGLLALVAVLGPLLSFRADLREARAQLQARMEREAHLQAEALALHFQLLVAELERLARRPEVDLRDDSTVPEQRVLDAAHADSRLFRGGVAVVDEHGVRVWSEPPDLLRGEARVGHLPLFQRLLSGQGWVVGALDPTGQRLAVAVPILQEQAVTGAVLGILQPAAQSLPGTGAPAEHLGLVVLGPEGRVFFPERPPSWAAWDGFAGAAHALLPGGVGDSVEWSGRDYLAAAAPVGETGLRLVVAADYEGAIAPIRGRFLSQLVFILLLQVGIILLFILYFRRSLGAFRQVEQRASEQEKLASLGTAASLIAHEVKNSLNGLNAAASLLESGGDAALPVRSIRGQTERLRHLASSLLHFGKPPTPRRTPTRVDQVVKDTLAGLETMPEKEVVAVTVDAAVPVEVSCDPMLLSAAVDNLLRNAIEAGAQARDLGTSTAPTVKVRVRPGAGGGAEVEVEDDAGGPPEGFEQALFTPFRTTKPKGIGLGLSMAARAIELQGGRLRFERTARGARFTILLPEAPR